MNHGMDELLPRTAISVHKSPGNEYPCSSLPYSRNIFIFMSVNFAFYRHHAWQKLSSSSASKQALAIAFANKQEQPAAFSRLRERLQSVCRYGTRSKV